MKKLFNKEIDRKRFAAFIAFTGWICYNEVYICLFDYKIKEEI